MKKFGFLALIGLLFLASFAQAQDTPTEDELQPDTVEEDLGAAREGGLFDLLNKIENYFILKRQTSK